MQTTSLAIRGYRDAPVPNQFHRQEAAATHLALMLPGFGYTCDMPLLFFTTSHLIDHGADILQVEYAYSRSADYRALDVDERHRWLLADVQAAWQVAQRQRSYQRYTIIGKSLGTRAMAHLLMTEPLLQQAHTIWVTPVWQEPLVGAALRQSTQPALVVIGTADPYYDPALVAELQAREQCTVVVVPDAEHGLEIVGDAVRSIQALAIAIQAVQAFVP